MLRYTFVGWNSLSIQHELSFDDLKVEILPSNLELTQVVQEIGQMSNLEGLPLLLHPFRPEQIEILHAQIGEYDDLLAELLGNQQSFKSVPIQASGILALNGASGAGQSYVLERVETQLKERSIVLPRIYLLGTRSPREGEGHKNPYIFVEKMNGGYKDIHRSEAIYSEDDIYYSYQSRPGAVNAILYSDIRMALEIPMYLETVIPTLLHIKTNQIGDVPAWGDRLRIVYLAVPSGHEWVYRLLNRAPERLENRDYRMSILGRVTSSLQDMKLAAAHGIPMVLNRHEQGKQAASEILSSWGF